MEPNGGIVAAHLQNRCLNLRLPQARKKNWMSTFSLLKAPIFIRI